MCGCGIRCNVIMYNKLVNNYGYLYEVSSWFVGGGAM